MIPLHEVGVWWVFLLDTEVALGSIRNWGLITEPEKENAKFIKALTFVAITIFVVFALRS